MKLLNQLIKWIKSLFKKAKTEEDILFEEMEAQREKNRQANAKYLSKYSGRKRFVKTGGNSKYHI